MQADYGYLQSLQAAEIHICAAFFLPYVQSANKGRSLIACNSKASLICLYSAHKCHMLHASGAADCMTLQQEFLSLFMSLDLTT